MRNQRRGKGADEASEVEQKVKKGPGVQNRDREGGGRAAGWRAVPSGAAVGGPGGAGKVTFR